MAKSEFSKNTISTPLVRNTYKLHCKIFHHFYSHPFQIHFNNCKVSLSVDTKFRLKYIPWLIAVILINTLIGFGSCAFVLLLKFFRRETQVDVVVIIFLVFIASCLFLEFATYLLYCKSTGIVCLINELLALEQNRKFSN